MLFSVLEAINSIMEYEEAPVEPIIVVSIHSFYSKNFLCFFLLFFLLLIIDLMQMKNKKYDRNSADYEMCLNVRVKIYMNG